MAFDSPTATEVKTRFPEFDPLSDSRVQIFITEASGAVSLEWEEADYKLGIIFLAAHMMALEGEPGRTLDPTAPVQPFTSGKAVTKRKVGDVETQYDTGKASVSSTGAITDFYNSTVYGQKFLRLLRLNAPAIAAV